MMEEYTYAEIEPYWAPTSIPPNADLRAAVTARVRWLKAEGLSPQRVLTDVKACVLDTAAPTLGGVELRRLVGDVVRWSIDAYYDAPMAEWLREEHC